jgi:hypothetical protein
LFLEAGPDLAKDRESLAAPKEKEGHISPTATLGRFEVGFAIFGKSGRSRGSKVPATSGGALEAKREHAPSSAASTKESEPRRFEIRKDR